MLLLILGEKLLASILAGFVPLVSQFGLLSAADSPPMYSASQNGHVMDIEDVDMTDSGGSRGGARGACLLSAGPKGGNIFGRLGAPLI